MSESATNISHEFIIPGLRNKTALKRTAREYAIFKRKSFDNDWHEKGKAGYDHELGKLFGPKFMTYCENRMLSNNGKLKIVSFGGGGMQGMLELKEMLEKYGREKGLESSITLVDYSLTSGPGKKGVKQAGLESLLPQTKTDKKTATIRIHAGPLETKNIDDAADADVMASTFGPFFHADTEENRADLIVKASEKLAPGAIGFFHVKRISGAAEILEKKLGETYTVFALNGTWGYYIAISRKN